MADGAPPSPRGAAAQRRQAAVPIGLSLEQLVLQSSDLSVEEKEIFAKQITPRSRTPQPDAPLIGGSRVSTQGDAAAAAPTTGTSRRSNVGEAPPAPAPAAPTNSTPIVTPLPAPPARRPPVPPPPAPADPPLTPRSRAMALPALPAVMLGEGEEISGQTTPRSRRPEPVRFAGTPNLPAPPESPRTGKSVPALPPLALADVHTPSERGSKSGAASPPPAASEALTPRSRGEGGSRLQSAVSTMAHTGQDALSLMSPRSIGSGISKLLGSLGTDDVKRDEKHEQIYAYHLALSRKEDLAPVAALNVIYRAGVDHLKRPVVVCLAEHIPRQRYDLDLLLLQAITVMHPVVDADYVFVYVHSRHLAEENKPKLSWLRKVYSALSRKYKKNLKAFYVVNHTFGVKMTLKMCKPFVSSKFKRKLKYVQSATDLYKHIDKDQLQVPEHYLSGAVPAPASASASAAATAQAQPIFGMPLAEACRRRPGPNGLPLVLDACLAYLATCAPETEGIFRLSGTSSNIDMLRKSYDKGQEVDLSLVENVHDVASLLKLYLRELPEPLFPYALYDSLLSLVRDNPGGYRVWGVSMKALLTQVPSLNRLALEHLMQLLNAVAACSMRNKMTASNLAIVFGPNVLRSQTESLEALVSDSPLIGQFITALIMYHSDIFA